jgi:hypothetical protein
MCLGEHFALGLRPANSWILADFSGVIRAKNLQQAEYNAVPWTKLV